MQPEADKQEQIKAKIREMEQLEKQGVDQGDLFEDDVPQQQIAQDPQQKYYDLEQVQVLMWCETINNILLDCPMSEFKRLRLIAVRNHLLFDMDLTEFIPVPQQESQQEAPPQQAETFPDDQIVEPYLQEQGGNDDLDAISKKLKEMNTKDGLMAPVPEQKEEEKSIIEKLLGREPKKKPVERTIDERHQSESMG